MSLIGTLQDTALVFEEGNVKVSNASTTFAFLTSRSLGAGTWLIHVDFAPSQDSGAFPNGDPDPYEIAIIKGSTEVASVRGEESNSGNANYTNQRSASLVYVHASTSTDTFKVGYKQGDFNTDQDDGGMAGRLSYHMYRLLNYS